MFSRKTLPEVSLNDRLYSFIFDVLFMHLKIQIMKKLIVNN